MAGWRQVSKHALFGLVLIQQEETRLAQRAAEEQERNRRALAAAEASARASELAADASLKSARWTMWAAIAAFLSVVISAWLQYFRK